jgi:hypothetical protein
MLKAFCFRDIFFSFSKIMINDDDEDGSGE